MRNKQRGEMALFSVIFVFVLVMVLFPVFEYFSIYEEAQALQAKIQTDLNSFATATNIDMLDNVKQGNLKANSLKTDDFENQMGSSLGLSKNLSTWSSKKTNYAIKDFSIQTKNTGHSIVLFAQYTLSIPLKILNVTVKNEQITQTAESYISEKYFSANQYKDKYITGSYKDDLAQTPETVTYQISVSAEAGGTATIDRTSCKNTEVCTATALPNQNMKFSHWENAYGVILSTSSTYSFTPTANVALKAIFADIVPEAPTINLAGGNPVYDPAANQSRLDNISLQINTPAENDALSMKYRLVIYGLTGWPYSSMSATAKSSFIYGNNGLFDFAANGSAVTSKNFTNSSCTEKDLTGGGKGFQFSATSCTFKSSVSSLGYSYIAIASYGMTAAQNGKANIKIYKVNGSSLSLVNNYPNTEIPSNGIGAWLYSK